MPECDNEVNDNDRTMESVRKLISDELQLDTETVTSAVCKPGQGTWAHYPGVIFVTLDNAHLKSDVLRAKRNLQDRQHYAFVSDNNVILGC